MSRILGIDLGAYSVKVVVASPGFRNAAITEFIERPVPAGDEPHEVRAARVLGQIVRERQLQEDSPFAALSGDRVFIHVLEFAFKSLKRPELQRAVGAELEGILPIDLEDMVYAFEPLPSKIPGVAPALDLDAPLGDDPAFAGAAATPPVAKAASEQPTVGMRVLACASMAPRIGEFLELCDREGCEPRGLLAAPASYPRVVERLAAAEVAASGGKGAPMPPVAVIDIGHERSDVCVVAGGKAAFVRTLARGGRHLTEAISKVWQISFQQAEAAKHQDGFVASANEPAQSEAWARIHEALAPEASALARDLRKTLTACAAKTDIAPVRAVLTGGGSRLRGIASYLSEQLGIPVVCFNQTDDLAILGTGLVSMGVRADVAALAAGVAFEGASGRPSFDLRQGELAYKADLSFLRGKITVLAASALAVIAFAAISAYANLHRLRKAEAALDKRLALESMATFQKEMSASDILAEVAPTGGGLDSPLPKKTAWDLLIAFNETLPPKTEVKIDIEDLDIKGGKLAVSGVSAPTATQNALQGIKAFEAALKKSKCFADVTSKSEPGTDDNRKFTFSIKTSSECL